jgi:hypothetical protein
MSPIILKLVFTIVSMNEPTFSFEPLGDLVRESNPCLAAAKDSSPGVKAYVNPDNTGACSCNDHEECRNLFPAVFCIAPCVPYDLFPTIS